MSDEPASHAELLGRVETALGDHGFDVERVEYDEGHTAVVVQYATVVGGADEIEAVLAEDVPKTFGAFQGAVLGSEDPDPRSHLIVLVVNSRTEPAERTGKLRWEIDQEWLPGDADLRPEEYEEPLQRILSTAAVIDEDGTHEVDAEFEFTDR